MRILNVDDNPQNLYLIEVMARARGYEVGCAHNGVEALEELERQPFDLIISDILMPQMDGFQLCHEVKSREQTKHIPFIIYTATYTAKQDEEFALSLGASRFVIKPMEPDQFLAVIEQVLAEAKSGAVSGAASEPKNTIDLLKTYNSRLVQKLDRKIEQLEMTRRALQASLQTRDREIAQRKAAEEERTHLEAQLLQSQKLESVGRLAGGIAHDFNNLLTVINGYSDLILRKLLDGDPLIDNVRAIRDAGEHAARLTKQLLAFSRRQPSDPKPLNLSQLVREMRLMIQRLVGDDVEIVTQLSPEVGPVLADEVQIHQVLMNLIVNARDAMPGGGKLTIQTERVEREAGAAEGPGAMPPGPCVVLTVSDTGTGMDRETLQRIFEPFFTTKSEGRGTGLGLSTVYGIVRQSGGSIQVESQPNHGSTFRVFLPESAMAVGASATASFAAAEPRGSETILVVEDNSSVRTFVVSVLRDLGYRVLEASSGETALRLAERYPNTVALLIADIQMPRMNGLELAERVRESQPGLGVLFASGFPGAAPSGTVLEGRGVSYIAKPFTPAALATKIRALLDSANPGARTAGPAR